MEIIVDNLKVNKFICNFWKLINLKNAIVFCELEKSKTVKVMDSP